MGREGRTSRAEGGKGNRGKKKGEGERRGRQQRHDDEGQEVRMTFSSYPSTLDSSNLRTGTGLDVMIRRAQPVVCISSLLDVSDVDSIIRSGGPKTSSGLKRGFLLLGCRPQSGMGPIQGRRDVPSGF
jgi:hypothetical protein